ncbi:MAG: GYF domain-containing protein [Bacteriovoracaceae bacterium]
MTEWYYVQGKDRVGPVDEGELSALLSSGTLNEESYVWCKGYEDWQKLHSISELAHLLTDSGSEEEVKEEEIQQPDIVEEEVENFPNIIERQSLDWESITQTDRKFHIKIGKDRGLNEETEYGPYSLIQLKKMYDEGRINAKTYLFAESMENWSFLADIPVFEEIFNELPPVISEQERRSSVRKPFIARLLFHDGKEVYEGICRDISVGGLQVLASGLPCTVGDTVKLNVHPDNSGQCFTAEGEVVRRLDGDQGFSIRFNNLALEAKELIDSYVKA